MNQSKLHRFDETYSNWGEAQTNYARYEIDSIALVDVDRIRPILLKGDKSTPHKGLISSQVARQLGSGLFGFHSGGHTDRIVSVGRWRRIDHSDSLKNIHSDFMRHVSEVKTVAGEVLSDYFRKNRPEAFFDEYESNAGNMINPAIMLFVKDRMMGIPVEYSIVEMGGPISVSDSRVLFRKIYDELNNFYRDAGGFGSFNDDDEPMLPATTGYQDRIQEMIVAEGQNPFLDQAKPFGIDRPEYTLMYDLIDSYEVPLPDFPVTTPDFTQGITNVAEIMRMTRANPRGILAHNAVGYIDSKSKFFQAVNMMTPMIPGDQTIIDLGEPQAQRMLATNQTGLGRVRKPRYRINLVALASQNGRPIMAPVLPFSNLFHTFGAYNQRVAAEMAYEQGLRALENFVGGNARMRRLGRR